MIRLIQCVLRKAGVDVRRVRPGLMDFIADRRIDLVLDVGANVGQFATGLRARGYDGRIVSFEPVSEVFARLVLAAQADPGWVVHNIALGAAAGTAVINVAEFSVFSSLRSITEVARQFDADSAPVRRETVEIRTLDEMCEDLPGAILLKVDTQGFEKQVLEGGRQTLARSGGVLLELPIIRLYEETWRFHEAMAFMADLGFVPAQIAPVNYHTQDRMSLLEVDCLFRPMEEFDR